MSNETVEQRSSRYVQFLKTKIPQAERSGFEPPSAPHESLKPLQLDIIRRLIVRYTNEGETVLDPFNGIGSTAYQALKLGRHALGMELNEDYWRCSVGYCEAAENEITAPTLFDLVGNGANLIASTMS